MKKTKAELEAELKALEEETPVEETPKEETPTEAPVEETDVTEEVEKAFARSTKTIQKSLSEKLDKKVDSSLDSMKADLEAYVKGFQKDNVQASKPTISFDMEEYKAFAEGLEANKKVDFTVELKDFDISKVKVVGDISIDGNITGELPQAELDTMVSRDPQRNPFIEELVRVGVISSNLDAWIETTGKEGAPLPVAELAALPQSDYDFVRNTAEVKKVGVYSKYSAEMAEDLPNLVTEIKNFLVTDLREKIDSQILSGDGTTVNLKGILEYATAWAAGDFAGAIDEANEYDVIETAVAQVVTALHTPNAVVLHPTDASKMHLKKGTDGHYVMPPFIAADGTRISGLRVVQNTGISAGDFLVGDFTKSVVKYKRGLTLEMTNTDQDDFIKDRFTVKATARLVHRVRTNDTGAFVTGTFSTAMTALETA